MKKNILHILLLFFLASCIEHKPYDTSVEVDVISQNKKDDILKGEELFKKDCRVCHHIYGIINPKYMNEKTIENYGENYFYLFVTQQDSLYKANDSIMMNIKSNWKNNANSHNFEYNKTELYQLKEYLKTF